jgi:hypothetical protein
MKASEKFAQALAVLAPESYLDLTSSTTHLDFALDGALDRRYTTGALHARVSCSDVAARNCETRAPQQDSSLDDFIFLLELVLESSNYYLRRCYAH